MLPYYLLLLIPLIVFVLGIMKGKRWNKPCIICFFLILIIILSLRGIKCGRDLEMYLYFFKSMIPLSFNQVIDFSKKGEPFYFLLNKLVSYLGGNFQVFLFVIALISIIPIVIFYSKKSEHGLLTVALFLTVAPFPMFFSGLRQITAMGLFILAFKYIEEKKLFKYILSILIISLFHKSVLITLLFYPVYHAKINKNWLYFIIPSFILIYLFNGQIFTYLIKFINPIYSESYGNVASTGQYTTLLLLIIFGIYCFIFVDKKAVDGEYNGFRNILLLSILLQCFVPINMVVMRLNYYSLLFVPVLITMVPKYSEGKNLKILNLSFIVMIVFFMSYFIYNGYTGNNSLDIFPYIPFWR